MLVFGRVLFTLLSLASLLYLAPKDRYRGDATISLGALCRSPVPGQPLKEIVFMKVDPITGAKTRREIPHVEEMCEIITGTLQ